MSLSGSTIGAGLSAVMPGLGQLYNREDAKAAAILCSTFGIRAGLVWTTVGPDASRSWLSAVALLLAYPFLLLPAVLDAHRRASGIRLTILGSLRCARLHLWDEDEGRLVGFRHLRALPAGTREWPGVDKKGSSVWKITVTVHRCGSDGGVRTRRAA